MRRTIAFALALTWEQDRVRALETLDRLERPSRKRERIFKGWVEALAADGFRPERARAAAQALLTEFETRQDGRPRPR